MKERLEGKLERRPKEAGTDALASSAKFLDWAYVPYGADRNNPLLSPALARKEDLPGHVYLIGAEYDMLCFEAKMLAERLVDLGAKRMDIPGVASGYGWRQGGIRWECARGRFHAFTHVAEWGREKERNGAKAVDELYNRVGAWLKDEVWADRLLQ
jgi:acetyl esterase/lipase